MTELIDKLCAGELPEFDSEHSNVERDAFVKAQTIINEMEYLPELRRALALILAEHALQEKCIEMQDYQIRGQTTRPWARSMDAVRKHL